MAQAETGLCQAGHRGRDGIAEGILLPTRLSAAKSSSLQPPGLLQDGEGCAGVSVLPFHPWNVPACAVRRINAGYPIPVAVNPRDHTSLQTFLHFQRVRK